MVDNTISVLRAWLSCDVLAFWLTVTWVSLADFAELNVTDFSPFPGDVYRDLMFIEWLLCGAVAR